jgi:Trypsin-like peptidase domain/PDZ domain
VPFTVVGTDPAGDLAVVRAQGVSGLTPITIGSSKDVKVGQQVVAIGSPLGLQGTVTTGIVSALDRPVAAGDGSGENVSVLDAIQTDAAINPGNSGGALVNMNGELIGVNSAIASMGAGAGSGGGQSGSIGLGFAIPADQAKRIADELVSTGTASHGSLGVQLSNDATKGGGAAIAEVVDGGPAAAAGLPSSAVITKIDEQVITRTRRYRLGDLPRHLRSRPDNSGHSRQGVVDRAIASCIPRVASLSASSLSATPACPFTQNHSTRCRAQAAWSRCHRSTFFTGCLAAVCQPLRSQPRTHLVMPFRT